MDDHYQTLGIDKSATQDQIKTAYRKLASKHHPDKGGDTSVFQKIQAAYEVLGDPAKRSEYDNPRQKFGPEFQFRSSGMSQADFEEILRNFGGFGGFENIFGQHHTPRRNRTLNLQTSISLEDAFNGKDLVANIQLPNGKDQVINVKIPAGINDGTTLRLRELGDDSIPGIARGDVHLTVNVLPHDEYQRTGDDLIKEVCINAFDAMLGTTVTINTLDKKTFNVTINPGVQHGTILAIQGHGMPHMQDPRFKGRILLKINVLIPDNLTDHQKDLIRQAKN